MELRDKIADHLKLIRHNRTEIMKLMSNRDFIASFIDLENYKNLETEAESLLDLFIYMKSRKLVCEARHKESKLKRVVELPPEWLKKCEVYESGSSWDFNKSDKDG